MSPLLAVRGLSVAFPAREGRVEALRDVSFDLAAGERLAVIGESGSGKTTLGLALAGLLPTSAIVAGIVDWPGLGRAPSAGRDIGFVFQDPGASLDPLMTVGEQVAEVAEAHLGLSRRQARAAAVDRLSEVGLPEPAELAHAWPHQLSGGQRQRVAIAAALAGEPRLLIADEPTSALDTIVQARIVALLARLSAERRLALVFISHDIALAAGLAERIAVFRHGGLVEIGPAAETVRAPRQLYTRMLLDAHLGLEADA
ncbi:MAG: ABC transporter ATP-binding protein [Mesorhizobium sp.]|jgi:peptide/nickel transport system ATP-binding protein